jgi:glycosyltransferase involved in cell wall biosynthesis
LSRLERVLAGGSVGHVAGVANNLAPAYSPALLTTFDVPTVDPAVERWIVPLPTTLREAPSLRALALNLAFARGVRPRLERGALALVYQRNEVDSYAGLRLARRHGAPFVLEYNGSELWVSEHWGPGRVAHAGLSRRIERLCLSCADVVVVVSQPLRDELLARGVEARRILVNPNGVDPDRYSPAVDGGAVRARLGLEGRTVLGFIGTFGAWHGAEVLVEAYARLLARAPDLRATARLLMIGDGLRMPAVRALVARERLEDAVVLTGLVPQAEGPAHLAACDVLVAPHVPNPDGSRFFGSPTKLFEYMAMGRGIVASRLEQLGEVLEHERTAWLAPPGDVDALADGLRRLVVDPALRARLGRAARARAVERHTWAEHTRRIVEALAGVCEEP